MNNPYETEYTHIERAERAFEAEERVYRRERHDDDAIEGRAENAHVSPRFAAALAAFVAAATRKAA
jgi:hypothetical protein